MKAGLGGMGFEVLAAFASMGLSGCTEVRVLGWWIHGVERSG